MYFNTESSQAVDDAGGDVDDLTAATDTEVESGKMTFIFLNHITHLPNQDMTRQIRLI